MDKSKDGGEIRVNDCLQQSTNPKMVSLKKIKFLNIIKLNNNWGQFYKNTLNYDYFKIYGNLHKIGAN